MCMLKVINNNGNTNFSASYFISKDAKYCSGYFSVYIEIIFPRRIDCP